MDEFLKLEGNLRSPDVFHPAEHFTSYGKVEYHLREYEKAKENFKNALECCETFPGSNLHVANLKHLAMTYTKTGEYHSAKKNYEYVLKILETSPGADHGNVAKTLNNYAWLCYSTEEYDKARINFEKAQKRFEESPGPVHPDLASCLANLARTCIKTGEYAIAKESIEKALTIRKNLKGHDHEDVAKALKIHGLLCYSTEEYDKAKDFFEKALELFKKLQVPDHVDVADCLNNLGLLYYTTGKYEKAKEFLEERVATCEESLGPYHDVVAETLENLVIVYEKNGEYEKAKKCHEKAKEIRKKAQETRKKAKEIRKRAHVAEYLEDGTRLSVYEIFHLSNKIGGNYDTLALLAGKSDKADIVRADNVNYPGPVEKATKILTYINEDDTFSRQQLANHLENVGLGKLAGELLRGEFRNPDSEKTREYKKAKKCYENAQEIYEKAQESRKKAQDDPGEDGTRLSSISIDELSQKIGGNDDRLCDEMSDKVTNIKNNNLQYPSPHSKAAEVLKIINKSDFSRKELADHLKKIGHEKSANDVLHGRFR
ncbi:nephrocystin-3-like [Xenia sp. Carnegie-2017]|uniref:nephrocystin-3-like n=1 Tax=Xenia sp. Carnegie-2017 TaxID=2897299 RepID=UPI001F0430D2|nr:nephrocystin-3-like [Xenia sp. Carnegie-2017]